MDGPLTLAIRLQISRLCDFGYVRVPVYHSIVHIPYMCVLRGRGKKQRGPSFPNHHPLPDSQIKSKKAREAEVEEAEPEGEC